MGIKAKVTVKVAGVADVYNYLTHVSKKLSDPHDALVAATREVGRYWTLNFLTEGGLAGSWANLAQRTIDDRISQGYAAGPIMRRASGLYNVAGLMVQTAQAGSRSYSTPYDPRSGHGITGKVTFDKSRVILTAEGPQVFNNWPGRRTPRPARPFWPTNQAVVSRAKYGVFTWLLDEVLT